MSEQTIGVDLGGTKLIIICDDQMRRFNTGPTFSPIDLESSIREFVAEMGLAPERIGIAVPGMVQNMNHIVACDVLPKMAGWRATQGLADIQCKTCLVNDVKAALAEEMHDAPAGITAGVVMAGTAVGAAFITEGKHLLGDSGWAGELGYMPIVIDGVVRHLDELAGGSFMASRRQVDSAEFVRLAHSNDASTLEIIREGGFALGAALATVINLMNPARLAVGGGAISLPGYWAVAYKAASCYSISQLWAACRLYPLEDNPAIAARGAVRFANAMLRRSQSK